MASPAESDIMAEKEIKFLHANFSDVRFSDGYCFATYEGSEDTFNDRLKKFISISSTSYIQAEKHAKVKSHKRYSQEGKNFTALIRESTFADLDFQVSQKNSLCPLNKNMHLQS